MWLQCKSDDDDILLPKLLSVKQRSQPMEEHRHNKLLDQVREDIRQELLGPRELKTTMVDTHVLNRGCLAVRSPLDSALPGIDLGADSHRTMS